MIKKNIVDQFKSFISLMFLILLFLLGGCKKTPAGNPDDPGKTPVADTIKGVASIKGAVSGLTFNKVGDNSYYVVLSNTDGSTVYEQKRPLVAELVNSDNTVSWVDAMYSGLTAQGDSVLCSGTITGKGGSVFSFLDVYKKLSGDGTFEISRNVKVEKAGTEKGFSTRVGFQRNVSSDITGYDFFVPSVWYKQNNYVPANALASSMADEFYWFREDRLPLPIFMARDRSTGQTFSVFHKDADGATFSEEDGLNRVIDGRMKFASVGMQNKTRPLIGVTYPGSEGERTGIFGMAAQNNRWAYRSHPVTNNFEQHYKMAFSLTYEQDYMSALRNTWSRYYEMANPPVYNCDLTMVYNDQINLLNRYWRSINNSAGFPFRIQVNGTAADADYNWNMGFVGQQLPNASLLIREGFIKGDDQLRLKGEQIVDWWAANALNANGAVRTWYDPAPQTWRTGYETFMRVLGDGMLGMLWAWKFEKKNGVNKDNWLRFCKTAADWVLTKQNSDGSFPRSVNFTTNTVSNSEKTNTSHIIPFLVELFFATGNNSYKQAALNAGNFLHNDSYVNFKYIGGTPDNPNVPDKEAASMALRAYLALYDLTKDSKWMDAALQAAYYYQTWIYCWNVPIPPDEGMATYPKTRGTTGLSIIASAGNGCDTYAAIDAFAFYRMYLYSDDKIFLNIARLCLNNTKQAVNWDRSQPIPGYGDPGIAVEAMNLIPHRGRSVGYYLPWQAYNFIEPMVLLKDVFGDMDIANVEKMPNKKALLEAYSLKRGY